MSLSAGQRVRLLPKAGIPALTRAAVSTVTAKDFGEQVELVHLSFQGQTAFPARGSQAAQASARVTDPVASPAKRPTRTGT